MTLITMGGEYQTRDGRPVRVLCVDRKGLYPVVAMIGDSQDVRTFSEDGVFGVTSGGRNDLIPVPKKHKRTVWMVHYPNGACSAWSYNPSHFVNALAITGPHEIEFTEGEGLSEEPQ